PAPDGPPAPGRRGTPAWLVRRRPETRAPAEAQQRAQRTAQPPARAEAVTLVRDCADLGRPRPPERLEGWLARATRRTVEAVRRCAPGRRDAEAALKAGGTVPRRNGPVEGHLNRLHMLKRPMLG